MSPLKYDADVLERPLRCDRESIEFWAAKYRDRNEPLYLKNINRPHTQASLEELFLWKIGHQFCDVNIISVSFNFISKRETVRSLSADISAKDFLNKFPAGGSIYRIFWLHCCYPKFPIYDMHVHRAMKFLKQGVSDELKLYSPKCQIEMYLNDYLPFYANFAKVDFLFEPEKDGIRERKADRALWWFGKCLRTSNKTSRRCRA